MEAETGRGAMVEAIMSPEVDMGGAYPAANFIRASVVQASSIFYNTPATLGMLVILRAVIHTHAHTHTHKHSVCLSVCLSQKVCLWWLSGWGSCGG
jgi:hypothetical protein